MELPDSLLKLFTSTSLNELLNPSQSVCILKDTATVEQALKVYHSLSVKL